MKPLEFIIYGRPVPYARMTQRSKYRPKFDGHHEYQKRVRSIAWGALLQYGRRLWDNSGPFRLEIVFHLKRKRKGRPDRTNLEKAIEDAMVPSVMKDDTVYTKSQWAGRVDWCDEGEEYTEVVVTPLENGESAQED